MPTIDFSRMLIDGQPVAPAAIPIAAAQPELLSQKAPQPVLNRQEFAQIVLQKILNAISNDSNSVTELLAKLLPATSQTQSTPSSDKLIEILTRGNDHSLLLDLFKLNQLDQKSINKNELELLTKNISKLIEAELTQDLFDALDQFPSDTAHLENQTLESHTAEEKLQPKSISETPTKPRASRSDSNSSDPVQRILAQVERLSEFEQITQEIEQIQTIANPLVRLKFSSTVARNLLEQITKSVDFEKIDIELDPQTIEASLQNLKSNPRTANQAHALKSRSDLIEFLFPKGIESNQEDVSRAFKLVLSSAKNYLTTTLQESLEALTQKISEPLEQLLTLFNQIQHQLSKDSEHIPANVVRALRQQLQLLLEHKIALSDQSNPEKLLEALKEFVANPDKISNSHANNLIALCEKLIGEAEHDRKQPLTKLLERLAKSQMQQIENSDSELPLKKELVVAVDRIIKGQEMIRQLAPVLQALSEPSVFFFPSFLSGLFSQLEVVMHPVPECDPEEENRRKKKSSALRTIEFSTSFEFLGDTHVKIQYGQGRILATLGFVSSRIVPFIQDKLPRLEQALRALGYVDVNLSARQSEKSTVKLRTKVMRSITA